MTAMLRAAAILLAIGTMWPAAAQQQSQALPPLDQLRAARERPLFAPSRRRPEVPVEVAAPQAVVEDKSLPFQLTGIVVGQDVRFAILKQNGETEELRLRANEKAADWTLEEIGDRFVILSGKGKRVRLWLYDDSKDAGITVNDSKASVDPAAKRDDVDVDIRPTKQPAADPEAPPPVRPRAVPLQRRPALRSPAVPGPRPN